MPVTYRAFPPLILTAFLCSPVHAELPHFPNNSLAPLYGNWDYYGTPADSYRIIIGPKWITTYHGTCPYRYKYKVTGIAVDAAAPVRSLNIDVEVFDAEYVGKSIDDCFGGVDLPGDSSSLVISIEDDQQDAALPIDFVSWAFCDGDTALLKGIVASNQKMHGCSFMLPIKRVPNLSKTS